LKLVTDRVLFADLKILDIETAADYLAKAGGMKGGGVNMMFEHEDLRKDITP
jgi:hypothetical protein